MNKLMLALTLVVTIIMLYFVHIYDTKYKTFIDDNSIKGHIGEVLIINKDTLMVIDYDFKKSKFVLSNDKFVSSDFLINYKQLTK